MLALGLLAPGLSLAAESAPVTSPRVTATLLSSRDAVVPGERFKVALVQKLAPHWHTYWLNPGDSGEPTQIRWELPPGAAAGDIQWPAPTAIRVEPLVNFGFEGMVLLPVEITVPADARPGDSFTLKADATWLVCEKICIPEEGSFTLDLPIGSASAVDEAAQARIDTALAALPQPAPFRGRLRGAGENLALDLPGLPSGATELRFFPISDTLIEHAADQPLVTGDKPALTLTRSGAFKQQQPEVSGVLVFRDKGEARALSLVADVDPALLAAAAPPRAETRPAVVRIPTPVEGADLTIWAALAFAFAGGLILNLMPCVLPVLFIKALGFAQIAHASRGAVREQGLVFLGGVLVAFATLAGAVIALGALGNSVGWGFQLQSPPLVIALAVVMVLIGLNLLGAFEIGASVVGVGDGLASRGGRFGAFMTGVLAVVVATPCTAPFMGAAIGYAVTQPPAVAFAVFMALALGFALPVVALSFAPGLLRLLPKPGRWMLVLKQAFAFPMFATAIWLVWVASVQSGPQGVLAALVAVLAAGFVVWLVGVTRGSLPRSAFGSALAALVVLGAGWFTLQNAVPGATTEARAGDVEAWSPERVAALQAQGKPVFVNFTAAWCITCIANERVALSRQEVKDAFAKLGVTYLKADWTNRDARIATALAEQGRAGVPLYLFYPGRKDAQPEILPQLLTADTVIAAAARAAGREAKTAAASP
ncbi:Cytochrome c-type biogenesis protein DsbD, protein-disulfide reductase [Hyphomicrobiales bacterium]|nr:Cytochrome c-type biogenesis protein DsbD, protein-disulfide reductase [Hyphomicrobiales bacterium]CAH1698083.1 Cytochrome c-type biogenesis protein DsbD, protein-disulfide reductase [Hyphomicrobiales bacterium]CAI0347727.1 thioredoxin:protein disulfide reductase [Hyphomicrobiales bacterium]